MIRGLFETHINVTDLERSTRFYRDVLGLEPAYDEPARRVRFFWIGRSGQAMLGLWEKPHELVVPQHFAFRATLEDVRDKSVGWLQERQLACYNFLDDGTQRPMVFCWMPALAIYFDDPDGHTLELIAMLPDEPRPEAGIVSWDEWQEINGRADAES